MAVTPVLVLVLAERLLRYPKIHEISSPTVEKSESQLLQQRRVEEPGRPDVCTMSRVLVLSEKKEVHTHRPRSQQQKARANSNLSARTGTRTERARQGPRRSYRHPVGSGLTLTLAPRRAQT